MELRISRKVSLIDGTSKPALKPLAIEDFERGLEKLAYRRASSSLNFASNSLLGGYLGRIDGSHANGFVVKNWNHTKHKNKLRLKSMRPEKKYIIEVVANKGE